MISIENSYHQKSDIMDLGSYFHTTHLDQTQSQCRGRKDGPELKAVTIVIIRYQ